MNAELYREDRCKVRCLFVEHSPVFRRWASELLSERILFEEAETFEDAVSQLKSNPYIDFILIDWEMVDNRGTEALKELKQLSKKPIILISGRELSEEEFQNAMDSGVVECLRKEQFRSEKKHQEASQPVWTWKRRLPLSAMILGAVASQVKEDMEKDLEDLDQIISRLST